MSVAYGDADLRLMNDALPYSRTSGVAELLLIAVPGGIEHYFSEISQAADAEEQERIGARYGIHSRLSTSGHRTGLVA